MVADAVEVFLVQEGRTEGAEYGVFVLSGVEDPATVHLENRIETTPSPRWSSLGVDNGTALYESLSTPATRGRQDESA